MDDKNTPNPQDELEHLFDDLQAPEWLNEFDFQPAKKKQEDEPLTEATAHLKTLSEELKHIDTRKESFLQSSEAQPLPSVDIDIGDFKNFQAAFRPSNEFVRTDDNIDSEIMPEQPTWWQRWREKVNTQALPDESANPAEIANTLRKPLLWLRIRAIAAPFVVLVMLYITLAQALPLPIARSLTIFDRPYLFYGLIAALHLVVLLLSLDIVAEGARQLVTLRLGRSFALTVSNFASLAFIYNVFLAPESGIGFLPFNAVAALSMMLALWARYRETMARYRSLKVAAALSEPVVVFRKEAGYERHGVFGRVAGDADGFVRQSALRDQAQQFDARLIPIFSVAALVFAGLACAANGHPEQFLWCYSLLTLAVAPFSIGLSFTLPYARLVKHLARFNACIAGWSAAATFSNDGVAVLTDHDIFPPGRVKLNGLVMFNDHSANRSIIQTASVLRASECTLSLLTDELLAEMKLSSAVRPVSHFEFHEEGGFSAELGHDRILVGSAPFMLRMGVKLPAKLPAKTAIYTAVNMSLACIFPLEYTAGKGVRRAVQKLLRHRVTPIFACRDFNITPKLLNEVLTEAGNHVEIPSIEQRLTLSAPEKTIGIKPTALMERDDITIYTECITSSIKLKTATKLNLFFHLLSSVGGLLLFFYLTYMDSAHTLLPHNVLLFFAMFLLPIWLISMAVSWG